MVLIVRVRCSHSSFTRPIFHFSYLSIFRSTINPFLPIIFSCFLSTCTTISDIFRRFLDFRTRLLLPSSSHWEIINFPVLFFLFFQFIVFSIYKCFSCFLRGFFILHPDSSFCFLFFRSFFRVFFLSLRFKFIFLSTYFFLVVLHFYILLLILYISFPILCFPNINFFFFFIPLIQSFLHHYSHSALRFHSSLCFSNEFYFFFLSFFLSILNSFFHSRFSLRLSFLFH